MNHASWLIKLDWLLELIINVTINHCRIINHASWLIKQSLSNHCSNITRMINHASWLIELDWLLEWKFNVTINHCRIINHASRLIKQSLMNLCWIINYTNNHSCELVGWTRWTTRMNNQCDNQSLSNNTSRDLGD